MFKRTRLGLENQRVVRRALVVMATILALTSAAAVAHAQATEYPPCDREPTEADVAAAKGAFQAGSAAYNEGDYQRAITYWEDAFRRDCTATPLLLNLARAYESADQPEQAIVALTTFNERNPNSSQLAANERRIARLEETIEAREAAPPPAETGGETTTEPAPDGDGSTPAPEPEPQPASSGSSKLGPILTMSVGGAAFLIGIAQNAKFRGDADSHREEFCPNGCPTDALTEKGNDLRDQAVAWGWFAGVGVAAVGVGVIWYFVGGDDPEVATKPRFTPQVGLGFAGVTYGGGF